ncbi:hypothetical protein KZC51_06340 [Microbacterium sp. SSW1-49]|uniref:Integral membrane protein n=1 Tax=Microbacterium croceum TaxID=2851645 RepID=A0ABT0FCF5_9MICO|nr:hypothetical protein [Microbacterium croceum]MCK2035752.1 hypothetical protein [Microbacterium croceum]
MHQSRRPAVLRGFAASSVAIFAALAGHVSAGGAMPGLLGIAVPWVLSFMVCVLLAGRRLSALRLTLSVAISQFLFHVLFVLGTVSSSSAAAVAPHVHGAPVVLPAIAGSADTIVALDATMWIGHAFAAMVTTFALHRGERLLLGLRDLAQQSVRWMQQRIDAVLAAPLPRRTSRAFIGARIEAPHSAPLLATLRGRAPPALRTV